MKITLYSILAAAVCGMALGQTAYTTPVGYTTQTLALNTFNSVGINVQTPTLAAGKITAVSGVVVSDTTANFTSILPAGKMVTIEITSGTAIGSVQELVSWSGSDLTLSSAITGLAVNDTYALRVDRTLQELFPVGLLTGGAAIPTNADIVWVPNGSGGYTKYWYRTATSIGWHTTVNGTSDAGLVTGDIPLFYPEGLLVQRKTTGTVKDLVISGEVKKVGTNPYLLSGSFNQISINPPTGLTLFTSGLQGDITGGAAIPTNADIVWVPNGSGGYTKYWYRTATSIGWHTTVNGTSDAGLVTVDVVLPPSLKIQRKATNPSKFITLDVPAFYSGL